MAASDASGGSPRRASTIRGRGESGWRDHAILAGILLAAALGIVGAFYRSASPARAAVASAIEATPVAYPQSPDLASVRPEPSPPSNVSPDESLVASPSPAADVELVGPCPPVRIEAPDVLGIAKNDAATSGMRELLLNTRRCLCLLGGSAAVSVTVVRNKPTQIAVVGGSKDPEAETCLALVVQQHPIPPADDIGTLTFMVHR